MQPRGAKPFQTRQPATVLWRGRSHTIPEAAALAAKEQAQGNLPAVAEIFHLILLKMPDSAELHNNLGAILQLLKRPDEALACYDRAIALKPAYANALYNRATTLKQLNRHAEALADFDRAIALKPDHVEAYNNRGVVLQQLRQYDAALASFDQAIALKPDHAGAHYNKATALVSIGRMPEAEQLFLRALELKPGFPDALFNLANIRKYRNVDNPDFKNIHQWLDRPGAAPEAKEQLYFTLGKIYDDCGRYDEAFDCFRQANEIRNRQVSYDAAAVTKMTDDIIAVFTREFLAQPFPSASASRSPLLIVGMPRSGTTLLANILSNHPAIGTAGELPTFNYLAEHLPELTGGGMPYPSAITQLTAGVAARLIQEYEQRLRRDTGDTVPHVVDKNPLNFRHLGFITLLFPQARIFHCTRDLLDTALSNYFQRFPLTLDYCFDLQNIRHYLNEYLRLMAHWRQALPAGRMIEVSYEDMILNTETAARRALDFLGLEWDARCLMPHTNPNAVETASQWQVRQPIYRDSLERWRHYEKHLGALKETGWGGAGG